MQAAAHIIATGVRTPLGLHSVPAAAAVRAGVSRLREHPTLLDRLGEPVVAAFDSQIDAGLSGADRFVSLAQSALREICEQLALVQPKALVPVFLALPEVRPGFSERDATEIGKRLSLLPELPCALGPVKTFPLGHAAGARAIQAGIAALAGGHELCLVGGVESYLHAETIAWLDINRQLANADGRSSFVPGEGAGFLVLSKRAPREPGLTVLASILSCETANERALIKTADVCLGEGLTAAVRQAVSRLGSGARVHDIVCDLNGERYRGTEWGFACLRVGKYFDDPLAYRAPADVWGDVGAASIPLFAVLTCQAAARGYARGPKTLLWASSEHGLRGAVVVESQNVTRQGGVHWQA